MNAERQPTFHGTSFTHEIVIEGSRVAFAESLDEAKIVAQAVSRVVGSRQETRIYAAFASLPHSSYLSGWEVR